jgi:hypothetical protein
MNMHIRPNDPLRCESRRPVRELGLLRWSLAATIVLAAALDALWLVPAKQQVQRQRPEPQYVTPHYGDMRRLRCRKRAIERELAAMRDRQVALEAEARAIDELQALARGDAPDMRSVEVTLVRALR